MPHIPSVTEIARNQKARLPRPSTGSKMEAAFQGLKK
jgi:hypothetical protein